MHRCPICDETEGQFTLDPFRKDYVCLTCAEVIQDTSGIDWAEVGENDGLWEMVSWRWSK